jgi:hypothetical protein
MEERREEIQISVRLDGNLAKRWAAYIQRLEKNGLKPSNPEEVRRAVLLYIEKQEKEG